MKTSIYRMKSNRRFYIILSITMVASFLYVDTLLGQWHHDEANPNNIPIAVRKAIQSDFAQWRSIKWYVFDRTSRDWSSMINGRNDQGIEPDTYVARTENGEFAITAVYNNKGELLSAETILKKVEMPSEIQESINNDYPEWEIKKYVMIIHDFNFDKKYHKVKIRNSHKGKTLYFDKNYQKIDGI